MNDRIIWLFIALIGIALMLLCGSIGYLSDRISNLEKRIIHLEEQINERN